MRMPASRRMRRSPLPAQRFELRSRRSLVEKFVNSPRRFGADTIDLHQVGDRRPLDRLERTEVVQQRPFPRWADARDFLQAGLAQIAHPARPMRTDRETMRLVAQPFDEIKHGIAWRQFERVAARNKEGL